MKKWIWIITIAVIIVIGLYVRVYLKAVDPLDLAEKKAVAIAKEKTDLNITEDFHLYHGTETIYVIEGRNSKNESIIVWIPEKSGKPTVIHANKGLSEQEAINRLYEDGNPKEILAVRLGMENEFPLWEIYYLSDNNLINYYYVHFETGERLKQIENL